MEICARRSRWRRALGQLVCIEPPRVSSLITELAWDTEDQELVHIHLEKVNKQQWWENVLTHHPKIDTTKIVPENSKLSDLDGETRCVQLLIDALRGNRTRPTLQRNGGEDDGTLGPPTSLPTSHAALPTSSIISRRYSCPLHLIFPYLTRQLIQQLGKPTSDELKKHEVWLHTYSNRYSNINRFLKLSQTLAKFQALHPELDFSNVKIS